jgi:hypothetical protein
LDFLSSFSSAFKGQTDILVAALVTAAAATHNSNKEISRTTDIWQKTSYHNVISVAKF